MKKDQIRIGRTYLAKVTDKVVPVRLEAENPHGGWDATNLVTHKKVRIKSAQRLRGPARERESQAAADAQAVDPDLVPLTEAMKPAKASKGPKDKAKGTKAKAARGRKAAGEPTAKKVSGLDAAHRMLKDAGEPMRCGDMVEKMLATGLWKTNGKTPAATLYSAIHREIQTKGAQARFRKTDRGLFAVNVK